MNNIDRLRSKLSTWWKDFKYNPSSPPGAGTLVVYLALIGFCNFLVWDISENAQKCDLDKIALQIENVDRKQSLIELKIDSLMLASRFGEQVVNDQKYWEQTEKNLKIIEETNSEIRKSEKSFENLCDEADGIHRETLILFLFVTFVFGVITVFPYRKVQRKSRKKNV